MFTNHVLPDASFTNAEDIYSKASTRSFKVLTEALRDSRIQFENRKQIFEMSLQHCYTKKVNRMKYQLMTEQVHSVKVTTQNNCRMLSSESTTFGHFPAE